MGKAARSGSLLYSRHFCVACLAQMKEYMGITSFQGFAHSLVTPFFSEGVRLHLPQLCCYTQLSWKWGLGGLGGQGLQDFIKSCLMGREEMRA